MEFLGTLLPATPCPVRPQVLFAQTACMPTSCKITCLDKYEFAGGATFLQTKCLNGTWTVQNNIKINSIPAQCERKNSRMVHISKFTISLF